MGSDRLLLSTDRVISVTGARLMGNAPLGFSGISIDSRSVEQGALFVALPGERVDGHQFLSRAFAGGALGAIVTSRGDALCGGFERLLQTHPTTALLIVPDTLGALQTLAADHRDRLSGVSVVGVTGSNGKTTTKELIGAVLRSVYPTWVNEGNLNSDIGLALSIFGIEPEHRFAVLEMGMNRVGEMRELARMARPDLAVITNIGTAHIGNIGSVEAIAEEKKAISAEFSGSQQLLVWEDEPQYGRLSNGVRGTVGTYGPRSTSGWERVESHGVHGATLHWRGHAIRLHLSGSHSVRNAIAAIHVGMVFGVTDEAIVSAIESVRPLFARGEILDGDFTIILDCYNANPESMRESLHLVDSVSSTGRRVAVLGAMKELGDMAGSSHRSVVALAMSTGLDRVFLHGEEFLVAVPSDDPRFEYCETFDQLTAGLNGYLRPGDTVLIKGSRSLALERLVPYIRGSGE